MDKKSLFKAIEILHNKDFSSNLTNEQIKVITILEGAYLDLDKEYTDKIARRNMQIKDLKKKYEMLQEFIVAKHLEIDFMNYRPINL